jgi:transcriptional regulator with XRE-family HTH domain
MATKPVLAANIRKARRRKDLTQEQVADLLGVHPVTVSKWERGVLELDEDALERLGRLLGVSPSVLRYGDANEPERPIATSDPLRAPRVRAWLADFRAELTNADATDEEIENAIALVTAPQVFTHWSGGRLQEFSEDETIEAMESLAEVVRQRLKQLHRR